MKIEQNKPHSIHLRLNEEQFEFCKTMANNADLGVSDFIRMVINTTMIGCRKASQVLNKMDDEVNAKLGEPHADDTCDKQYQL